MRDRVLIIGDVLSGFRIHGPFADNAEAFDYGKRHAERFPSKEWKDGSLAVQLVNFDTMTPEQIAEYESEVGGRWSLLEEA